MAVYIHERIDIEGGGCGTLIEPIRGPWAAHARERYGVRLAGVWATVGSTANRPEVQLFWEMDDWTHFARAHEAQYPLEDKDAFGTELWFQATRIPPRWDGDVAGARFTRTRAARSPSGDLPV